MNVLYGIQGTGHGHISRAKALLPELGKHVSVDVLISGYACQLELENFNTLRRRGVSLIYDNDGGVAVLETLRNFKPIRFLNDIQSIELEKYDLVISDYEPVTSWAARISGIWCLAMSHQAAFLSPQTPRPRKESIIAEQLLQRFAPADDAVGFHFKAYDSFVEPPIIREEIQQLSPTNEGHITVYLPAYHSSTLVKMAQKFPQVRWHIFSPECNKRQAVDNAHLHPVSGKAFLNSLETCAGVMTSAGFEMCSEAMYLNKKLIVLPIRNQYEQQCNAAALKQMGVRVLPSLNGQETVIWSWLENTDTVKLHEIADPNEVVSQIIENNTLQSRIKRRRALAKE